jgi:glycosyltransferase involved in cell wall biosynthesis
MQEAVTFAGSVPNSELADYHAACNLLVLPSRRESFGIAALEAMACARPVIGARVGGIREIIDDRETGLLVDREDPQQLAASILRILGDDALARRLGSKARRKVEADFDWASVGRRTAALYREVLADTVRDD